MAEALALGASIVAFIQLTEDVKTEIGNSQGESTLDGEFCRSSSAVLLPPGPRGRRNPETQCDYSLYGQSRQTGYASVSQNL